ncbi:MAG TPA: DNA repair protein RecO [Candidatus Binataceae bacterium]|nr:DNA repair protein RecO [Candidatus Binataceae bacterium]
MPAEESTPAIVLRARDYMESDRIVTLLTEQAGKLGGIAKGAKASRRRFEHRLEPFSHVMLYFRRRPHGQLVFITRAEAAGLEPFRLEDDLGRLALGAYMLDLADALTSEDAEASGAYRLLAEALSALGAGEAGAALRQAYELQMFRWAGFGIEFDRCRVCGESQAGAPAVYFIIGRGGIVCARCRDNAPEGGIRLSAASAAALADLQRMPLAAATSAPAAGADGALAIARSIASVVDRKLRSVEFLDSVIAPATRA